MTARRSPSPAPAGPTSSSLVEIDGVEVSFGEKAVLRGVSLRIEPGETVAILGESGGGKTVLLKVMLGLVVPDRGTVRLFGLGIAGLSEDAMIPIRKRCSVVYQGGALFSGLNVGENIALELDEVLRLPRDEIARRVRESLEAVGLADVAPTASPDSLSGGMRKRLAVARAIAPRPELIVYDEPTSGLDPLNSARIFALIRTLHDRFQVTSVVVTHDVQGACSIANRILLLSRGRIAFDGPPAQFRASNDPVVMAYRAAAAGIETGAASGK